MNLLEAISFAGLKEIEAGGPGSGCHGPHCGRPKGDGSKYHEKDIVKLLKPDSLWNTKTGNVDKFPAGKLKGVVVNVLPKIGDNPQMLKVNIMSPTKKHEADQFRYISTDDVKMHKSVGETIEPAPVPKSKIQQQFKSNDGSMMTVVKSPEMREYTPKTMQEMAQQPSRYKGQFQEIEKVEGADNQTTRVYDTSRVPSTAWGREGAPTAAPRAGVTLWVHRYDDHVTIQEQPYLRWGQKSRGIIQWKYDHPQRFLLQSMGMLKKRYGISVPSQEKF